MTMNRLALRDCTMKDFRSAISEIFIVCMFALMPLWIGIFISKILDSAIANHYVKDFYASGDLLLICTGILGPALYPLVKRYQEEGNRSIVFPSNVVFLIIIFVLSIIVSSVFVISRLTGTLTPDNFIKPSISFDGGVMLNMSNLILFLCVSALLYITTIKNMLERSHAPSVMRSNTDSFLHDWKSQ